MVPKKEWSTAWEISQIVPCPPNIYAITVFEGKPEIDRVDMLAICKVVRLCPYDRSKDEETGEIEVQPLYLAEGYWQPYGECFQYLGMVRAGQNVNRLLEFAPKEMKLDPRFLEKPVRAHSSGLFREVRVSAERTIEERISRIGVA